MGLKEPISYLRRLCPMSGLSSLHLPSSGLAPGAMCRVDSLESDTLVYNTQPGPARAHCFVVRNVSNNHHERKCHSPHRHHASENINVKTRNNRQWKMDALKHLAALKFLPLLVLLFRVVRRDKKEHVTFKLLINAVSLCINLHVTKRWSNKANFFGVLNILTILGGSTFWAAI